ncbi:MAG: hypothetical protein QOC98_1743 [Frankiaceae bacterium]|nr:hypothetical protein [Frankiaceae bacterium]
MTTIALRAAAPEDTSLQQRLFLSGRPELAPLGEALVAQQRAAQQAQFAVSYPDRTTDVVLVDGVPVGQLVVDRDANRVRLVDIVLLPEQRGHGLGTALLNRLIEEAGPLRVELHVARDNPAARLYARLGFQVHGDEGVYLEMHRTQPKTAS